VIRKLNAYHGSEWLKQRKIDPLQPELQTLDKICEAYSEVWNDMTNIGILVEAGMLSVLPIICQETKLVPHENCAAIVRLIRTELHFDVANEDMTAIMETTVKMCVSPSEATYSECCTTLSTLTGMKDVLLDLNTGSVDWAECLTKMLNRCSTLDNGISCMKSCHALAEQAPGFLQTLSSRREVLTAISSMFQKFHLDVNVEVRDGTRTLQIALAKEIIAFYALCSDVVDARRPLHDVGHCTQQIIDALALEFTKTRDYARDYCCHCIVALSNLSLDPMLVRDMIECGVPSALVATLMKFDDQEIQRRCIFAMSNLSSINSESHHMAIIKQGEHFCLARESS
jgi:hypothetical protein